MPRLNDSRAALEAMVREYMGGVPNRSQDEAARIEAARLAKAIRPYWLVVALDDQGATVAARQTLNCKADKPGFDAICQSFMTDQMQESALLNIYRGAEKTRALLARPKPGYFFAGDMGADNNRKAPPDPFYLTEPYPIGTSEIITVAVTGAADTLSTTLTNTFFVMRCLNVYPNGSSEAQLTSEELDGIRQQMQGRGVRQEDRFVFADIDMTGLAAGTYTAAVDFDQLNEWCLLRGIASNLRWSMFDFISPQGKHEWTNNDDGIPSTACAAYNAYTGAGKSGTTFEFYREFTHPLLIPPYQNYQVKSAKRAAAGGYTNNVTEADTGTIALHLTTV